MKILLIYPYCLEARLHAEDASVVPMGLYYIGAILKASGYDVEICNLHNTRSPQQIQKILKAQQPDIIGFSIFNANRLGGLEIARIAKALNPDVRIVFGGVGATFLWEHFLTHFHEIIDAVVIGEGEYAFLNLVKSFEANQSLENIRGIAFRKGDAMIQTPLQEQIHDLDTLPIPAEYFTYQHLSLTRGCPGNCTFCGSPKFWGRKVRFHSPAYFVNQLEMLYHKGITFFFFSDDMFTLKPAYVIEICQEILRRRLNITWVAISHVSFINKEMLYQMRKAGCVQISYGVESGSETIRNVLNKPVTTEQIQKAFSLTTQYGILARAYFIYGSPGETEATIQETLNLIDSIRPLSIIFYILDIFPGTALYEDFKARSLSDTDEKEDAAFDDIWLKPMEDILYFETDTRLTREDILAFGQRLRTVYYNRLATYTEQIAVLPDKQLFALHADFFSRLAMTFTHGDYAQIEAIQDKEKVAERLYRQSLEYAPNHRAFLGLGILRQQSRDYADSVKILSQGLRHFPESESLNMCIGISYMNMGEYANALPYFLRIQHTEGVSDYISKCHQALKH